MLGHKTAIAGGILVGTRLGTRAIDLVAMLIFARLLAPHDFGVVALAMSLVMIAEAIFELPIGAAMIRLPSLESRHYDTAFTMSALRGLIVVMLLWGLSWPFARYYGNPQLVLLICVLSLAPAARGLVSPRVASHIKDMNFWRIGAAEAIGKSVAAIIAMLLAANTHSYWSIAVYTVTAPVGMMISSFCFAPYRPRFCLQYWRSFVEFIGWAGIAQILAATNWQFERLLLGKLYGPLRLGLFTTANDLTNIPVQSLLAPAFTPLMSTFCRVDEAGVGRARCYLISGTAMVTLGLPILVGESLVAGPMVHVLLGAKWSGAVPMLQWLTLSIIPTLIGVPFGSLVMSAGRTKLFFYRNLFELCIKIPFVIVCAIKFGVFGVIGARFVSEMLTGIYCLVLVRSVIGVGLIDQLVVLWRTVVSVVLMAVAVSALQMFLAPYALGDALTLALAVPTGVAVYCACLLACWHLNGRPAGIEGIVQVGFRGARSS